MNMDQIREMFGPVEHLLPGHAARLVLRPQGDSGGLPLTMVVGVIHGEPRHPQTVADDPIQDELLFCKIVLVPQQRFVGGPKGYGAGNLLTDGGIYPGYWSRQVEGEAWATERSCGKPTFDPYK